MYRNNSNNIIHVQVEFSSQFKIIHKNSSNISSCGQLLLGWNIWKGQNPF